MGGLLLGSFPGHRVGILQNCGPGDWIPPPPSSESSFLPSPHTDVLGCTFRGINRKQPAGVYRPKRLGPFLRGSRPKDSHSAKKRRARTLHRGVKYKINSSTTFFRRRYSGHRWARGRQSSHVQGELPEGGWHGGSQVRHSVSIFIAYGRLFR